MVCTTPEKIPGYSFSLHVHVLYSLPKYMFLDLPRDVIRSVARVRLRVHTLRFETATWNPSSSPTCDLREADDDVQDEQHAISTAHTPIQCLFTGSMSPCSKSTGCFYFLHQNNNKLFST